ncbi:single-stranded-DNA-specific exonuclease RecJ [Candidatus Bipolaricaulota bacterium]|nr:single-stranded-DNA-specific exonuclease RecJ [Candidatus Bipolaricaulota bacterium]MCF7889690.1 single-stranded-DNA-specific exonuclease RecJ [Candidatus Bipolaricaulota bacterium]
MKSLLSNSRIWTHSQPEGSLVDRIREKFNCSRVFAGLVASRYGENFQRANLTPEEGEDFPEGIFHPPDQLPDLSRAVDRLIRAVKEEQDVFIHGDFDVDGLSSAALVYRGLKSLENLPGPGRLKVDVGTRDFGHGISKKTSSRLIDEEFDLVITTDCGVKGIDEISHLNNFGIDVIVTDHHEPSETLPPALAVVDPKRSDTDYPNPHLSGAGVAYKLVERLMEEVDGSSGAKSSLIQLAALGTVSDLVPLVVEGEDENRWLVKVGLEKMRREPITGISALLGELGSESGTVNSETVSYRIAPKLNSANRVGDPQVSFLLLATRNRSRANHLAKTLIDYDRDRSRIQNKLTRKAINQVKETEFDPESEGLVFVVGDEWNPGILGLVSSRLSGKFNLPAVTVSRSAPRCRGSVRGIAGLSVYQGLNHCSRYLTRFGGHEMAGGFTADSSDLDSLRCCLKEWASSQLDSYEKVEENSLVDKLDPVQANMNLYREIQSLAPFGMGNPEPYFWMDRLKIISARRVGNSKNHLKLKLAGGDEILDCIGFGMGENLPLLKDQESLNPVFRLELNDWRGREKIQLKLKDFVLQD